MKASLLGIDLAAKKATIVDSGDEPFSATNLDDIGKAVVSILKKSEETANKYLSEYCPQPMSLQRLEHRERPCPYHTCRLESPLRCFYVHRERNPLT